MKIFAIQNRNEVEFEVVKPGETFWFDNKLFIKTIDYNINGKCGAVRLYDGKTLDLSDEIVILDNNLHIQCSDENGED